MIVQSPLLALSTSLYLSLPAYTSTISSHSAPMKCDSSAVITIPLPLCRGICCKGCAFPIVYVTLMYFSRNAIRLVCLLLLVLYDLCNRRSRDRSFLSHAMIHSLIFPQRWLCSPVMFLFCFFLY